MTEQRVRVERTGKYGKSHPRMVDDWREKAQKGSGGLLVSRHGTNVAVETWP